MRVTLVTSTIKSMKIRYGCASMLEYVVVLLMQMLVMRTDTVWI